eukprot:6459608-Ditylum_brightwellii.AAC.1
MNGTKQLRIESASAKNKEAKLEISRVLDKVTKSTNKTSALDQKSTELEEWRTNFNADQKKRFCDGDKKLAKKLDTQTQSLDTKISELSESMNKKMSTQQDSTHQLLCDMQTSFDMHLQSLMGSIQHITGVHTTNDKSKVMRRLPMQRSWRMQMLPAMLRAPFTNMGGGGGHQ